MAQEFGAERAHVRISWVDRPCGISQRCRLRRAFKKVEIPTFRVRTRGWTSAVAGVEKRDGRRVFSTRGFPNRLRCETAQLDELVGWVYREFPGGYGLLFERADDISAPLSSYPACVTG